MTDKEESGMSSARGGVNNLKSPQPMEFTNPSSWPVWKRRFIRYMFVSGYNSKHHKEQIDILLYLPGEHAEEILPQFQPAPDTQEQALQAFREYCNPRTNIIFEQYKFNSRV
ncbi:hypothetical protein PR048_028955 [Dryococelus australis]|uniref:Uncharacterized protein n=1 Tax=Dryococelus australis TaxID=614101 RepID=A0ABQ9GC07_9NEOP|nr:hypothetical protein PR048_028955 [Dryococelus australis]